MLVWNRIARHHPSIRHAVGVAGVLLLAILAANGTRAENRKAVDVADSSIREALAPFTNRIEFSKSVGRE